MSYIFFSDIITEQGHKLNYEAVVNYAGNSFCKDSWDMIQKANPFGDHDTKNVVGGMMDLFNQAKIVKVDRDKVDRKYSWDMKEGDNKDGE